MRPSNPEIQARPNHSQGQGGRDRQIIAAKLTFVEYILWRKQLAARRFAGMTGEARRLIARNLRKLRTAHGMTQEDLAAAAGIDRSYVSEIENERFSVSADLVEKLAEVFGVAIFEMYHPDTATRLEADGKA